MKVEGVKEGIHRFVIERKISTFIHEFKRENMLENVDKDNYVCAQIDATMTCSGFPVQYEGTINGKNFYYRDRHGNWSFEVYDGEIFESQMLYSKEGVSKEVIGYKGFLFAEKIIYKQAIKFARKFKQYMPKKDF